MSGDKNITIYRDRLRDIWTLPKEKRDAIIISYIEYVFGEKKPEPTDDALFDIVVKTWCGDYDRYIVKSESGRKGGIASSVAQSNASSSGSGKAGASPEADAGLCSDTKTNTKTETKTYTQTSTDTEPASAGVGGEDEAEIMFSRFWDAYPKKMHRSEALRAFTELNPDSALTDVIVNSVIDWKTSDDWEKDGGKYIPLPENFLSKKRYLEKAPRSKRSGYMNSDIDWGKINGI